MDADVLSDALEKNLDTKVKLVLHCEMLDEVKSYNVIGEITGSEFPNEIIVVGGHLDSWDVGEGAHDDGAGCVQSMEVIRALKALNIRPKRTIRCVLFMNEENGVRGGNKYGEYAKSHATEKHVAAIESDAGGFSPRGFSIEASSAVIRKIADAKNIFLPYGLYTFPEGHSGTDIEPLKDAGTALFGLVPDSQRYMDLHHTANDTFDKINKRELHSGAAAMAMFAWWLSENGL
jgi:Zn-dependent M28 family amino/carboxypeptidase